MTDTQPKEPSTLQKALEEVAKLTGVQPWVIKRGVPLILTMAGGAYGWYKADMSALNTKIDSTNLVVQQNFVEQSKFKERTTTSLEYIQRSIDRLLPPAQRIPQPDYSAIEEKAEDDAIMQLNGAAVEGLESAATDGGSAL